MLGTEPTIKEQYVKTGQVKLVFAPVLNHQDWSYQAHQAAECAADQGQFWQFHQVLFENQDALWQGDIQITLKQLAAEYGLDTEAFNTCLDEQRHLELILAQDEVRRTQGIRGQPVFDINGTILFGSLPLESFQQAIDQALVN